MEDFRVSQHKANQTAAITPIKRNACLTGQLSSTENNTTKSPHGKRGRGKQVSRQRKRPLTEETSLNKEVNSYILYFMCSICSFPSFKDNSQEGERNE